MKLYKVLNEDGSARMGRGSWFLPKGKRPGKWMPPIEGDLIPCKNGYHLCRRDDLLEWIGPAVFEAEYRGEIVEASGKVVVREARIIRKFNTWNERKARLFAADCAERVLHLYEGEHPGDSRVRNAIEVARKVARGELPVSELDAARVAVWAASAAARDARAAARAAAWDARAAARAAAWDAWDAGDAASAAAWAASAAAWDARDAAGAAAGDAAGDARAAEREWQTQRLFEYLNGERS